MDMNMLWKKNYIIIMKKNHRKHKIRLEDIESHRGLGRSILLGGGIGGGGMIGGYLSKEKADDLDREGKSDGDIKRGATRHGRNTGAIAGALIGGLGAAASASLINKSSIYRSLGIKAAHPFISGAQGAVSGGLIGALGGHLGAKKNVEKRLAKRKELEGRDDD